MRTAPKKLKDIETAARARLQAAYDAAGDDPHGWDSTASDAEMVELGTAQEAYEAAFAAVCKAIAPKPLSPAGVALRRHLTRDR